MGEVRAAQSGPAVWREPEAGVHFEIEEGLKIERENWAEKGILEEKQVLRGVQAGQGKGAELEQGLGVEVEPEEVEMEPEEVEVEPEEAEQGSGADQFQSEAEA